MRVFSCGRDGGESCWRVVRCVGCVDTWFRRREVAFVWGLKGGGGVSCFA